jgi:hypothetical protein
VEQLLVADSPGRRTVAVLVTLPAPDGSRIRLLARVLLSVHAPPVVLLAVLDGLPQPGMVPPVADLLAGLPPSGSGLPEGPWAASATWAVLTPAAPHDPHGLVREVEVDWRTGRPLLTGRERVLPPGAGAALYADRQVRPVGEVVAELLRAIAPAR